MTKIRREEKEEVEESGGRTSVFFSQVHCLFFSLFLFLLFFSFM